MPRRKTTKSVLVTSGPTRAYFDRIRYIANTSSGRLGARIAEALINRNIPVVHIFGAGSRTPVTDDGRLLKPVRAVTVDDLVNSLRTIAESETIGAVVHAMAVLDYVPESRADGKKPSDEDHWDIRLVRTPKVIGLIRDMFPDACTVGFKLESGVSDEELIERAVFLLDRYDLDLVVANLLERVGDNQHEAFFIGKDRKVSGVFSSKEEIAAKLADFVAEKL